MAAGASLARSISIALPPGLSSDQIRATITTDAYNNVAEYNAAGTGESNNVGVATAQLPLAPYPDLVVSSVTAPASVYSGRNVDVSWTTLNSGTATTSGTWTDAVYLTDGVNHANDVFLAQLTRPNSLAAGQSYSRSLTVAVPDGISGTYYILVRANNGLTAFESNTGNDTQTSSPLTVYLSPYADLQVATVSAPLTDTAGQPLTVTWTVKNFGTGATDSPLWSDAVYLSTSPTSVAGGVLLGKIRNPSYLNSGESYSQSLTATIPNGLTGNYYADVVTDVDNQQYEAGHENNNLGASGTTTRILPVTNIGFLHVATVVVNPSTVISGQTISVNWTVTNTGNATITPGDSGYWDDGFALSPTTTYDGIHGYWLGGHQDSQTTPIAPGQSYSQQKSVALPANLTGTWYLVVVPDTHYFTGGGGIGSSTIPRDQGSAALTIQVPPSPDLVVTSVTEGSGVQAGSPLHVQWTVSNAGFGTTGGAVLV